MRGMMIGTVLALIFWSFAAWCVVGSCAWLRLDWVHTSPATLGGSLVCIAAAALTAAVWTLSLRRAGRHADDLRFDASRRD